MSGGHQWVPETAAIVVRILGSPGDNKEQTFGSAGSLHRHDAGRKKPDSI